MNMKNTYKHTDERCGRRKKNTHRAHIHEKKSDSIVIEAAIGTTLHSVAPSCLYKRLAVVVRCRCERTIANNTSPMYACMSQYLSLADQTENVSPHTK